MNVSFVDEFLLYLRVANPKVAQTVDETDFFKFFFEDVWGFDIISQTLLIFKVKSQQAAPDKLRMKHFKRLIILAIFLTSAGCGNSGASYSLLPEVDEFSQSAQANNKVDILWMVDGSATMANHQANLANNFQNFITNFANKGFDYHMAVASTDAWIRERNYNAGTCYDNPNTSADPLKRYNSSADCKSTLANFGQLTHFRDGDIYGTSSGNPVPRSGKYLIESSMPFQDVLDTFKLNIRVGTRGDGTGEAGLASLRAVLRRNADGSQGYSGETHTSLDQFRRPGAFLAVIVVSDEEDQSRKQNGTSYSSTSEYVQDFIGFMNGYTGSDETNRKYNLSTIVLNDRNNCSYGIHDQATEGKRYIALAEATKGVVGNICSSDFSSQLNTISQQIVTLATRYQLSREPVVDSIKVVVNGSELSEGSVDGWSYVAESGSYFIEFNGSAVPPQGASISIDYDPVAIR